MAENSTALEAEEIDGAPAEAAQDETTDQSGADEGVDTVDAAAQDAPDAEAAPAVDESSAGDAEGEEPEGDESAVGEDVAAEPEAALPTRDADGFSSALPESEGLQRKHVPGGIGYEIIFVVRSGDQKLVDESSQRVHALIEEQCEGAVDNVRASEVRRFAYPIHKQTEGVYVVINARFKPEHTPELDRYFKLDENVLRHMMLKEDN